MATKKNKTIVIIGGTCRGNIKDMIVSQIVTNQWPEFQSNKNLNVK